MGLSDQCCGDACGRLQCVLQRNADIFDKNLHRLGQLEIGTRECSILEGQSTLMATDHPAIRYRCRRRAAARARYAKAYS